MVVGSLSSHGDVLSFWVTPFLHVFSHMGDPVLPNSLHSQRYPGAGAVSCGVWGTSLDQELPGSGIGVLCMGLGAFTGLQCCV